MQILGTFILRKKTWTVVRVKNLHALDGDKCDGLCDPHSRIISIEWTLSRKRAWDVYLHEVSHALLEIADSWAKAYWADLEIFCWENSEVMVAAIKPFPQGALW